MNPSAVVLLLCSLPTLAAAQEPAGGIPACDDMKKTASGLEYGVLKVGSPTERGPKPEDIVVAHYTGWLLDGTKFDSSRDKGEPLRIAANRVIPGWTEGLQLMTPGARYKFVIPPELGYGSQQSGTIPPDSTLVFDVELLDIVRMPVCPAKPAGESKTTGSGVSYTVLTEGTGEPAGPGEGLSFRFAIWRPGEASDDQNEAGAEVEPQLLQCSEQRNDFRIGGVADDLPFPWLQELVSVFRRGTKLRVEVPQALFPNAQADSIWTLELVDTAKIPEFRELDSSEEVTTDSGLVYEVIEPGTGKSPKARDTVVCHYTGWLLDGTRFDSSRARAQKAEFALDRVIPGWTEGLQLMREGGVFLFRIPSELAYGPQERGKIPANSTLIFLVELEAVK